MNRITIVQGADRDYAVQCWLQGGASHAIFGPNDVISGAVFQGTTTTPLFIPTVGWWTNNGLQFGFTQGQVLVGISNDQSAMLVPGGRYSLIVYWSPAVSLSKTGVIVRMALIVEPKQNI